MNNKLMLTNECVMCFVKCLKLFLYEDRLLILLFTYQNKGQKRLLMSSAFLFKLYPLRSQSFTVPFYVYDETNFINVIRRVKLRKNNLLSTYFCTKVVTIRSVGLLCCDNKLATIFQSGSSRKVDKHIHSGALWTSRNIINIWAQTLRYIAIDQRAVCQYTAGTADLLSRSLKYLWMKSFLVWSTAVIKTHYDWLKNWENCRCTSGEVVLLWWNILFLNHRAYITRLREKLIIILCG